MISACTVALIVITHLPKQIGDYQPPVLQFKIEKHFAITTKGELIRQILDVPDGKYRVVSNYENDPQVVWLVRSPAGSATVFWQRPEGIERFKREPSLDRLKCAEERSLK